MVHVSCRRSTRVVVTSLLVSSIALVAGVAGRTAAAFDTGHHFDLTREALREAGFGGDAIRAAQVCNWLVDYYSNQKIAGLSDQLELLHFDNLTDEAAVNRYWAHLTANTHAAVVKAARDDDPRRLVALLGISLHVVQDFYTHSNWAESFPRPADGSLRTETWFSVLPSGPVAGLRTGGYPNGMPPAATDHGDYHSGMNHDCYGRERWDESYAFAFAGSVEWVAAVRGWVEDVNAATWQKALTLPPPAGLDADVEAAYRFSEWIAGDGADGHWKGEGSGDAASLATFAPGWMKAADSPLVALFKNAKLHEQLTPGLADGSAAPAVPRVARIAAARDVVCVRTRSVRERDDVGVLETKIDSLGKPDFYALVTVDGLEYVEAMQLDRSSITPAWTTLRFLTSGTSKVAISYRLFDEDGGPRKDDDECDIRPGSGRGLAFDYELAKSPLSVSSSGSGDSDRADVTLEITTLRTLPQPALSLGGSVGDGGANAESDVRIVQDLLNAIPSAAGGASPRLATDGKNGPKTIAAIRHFQSTQGLPTDGRVDAGGQTLARLNAY